MRCAHGAALGRALLAVSACGGVDPECDVKLEPGDDDTTSISAALSTLRDGQTSCLAGGRFVDAPLGREDARAITIAGAAPRAGSAARLATATVTA